MRCKHELAFALTVLDYYIMDIISSEREKAGVDEEDGS